MKELFVKEMFECPFQYDEIYQLSELTSGVDTKCTLTDDNECTLKDCPLKHAQEIKVTWLPDGEPK